MFVDEGDLVGLELLGELLGDGTFIELGIGGKDDKETVGCGLQVSAEPIASSACWGAWNLTFERGDARQVVPACDFASAAPSDDWHNAFSIWFVAPVRDEEDKGNSGD